MQNNEFEPVKVDPFGGMPAAVWQRAREAGYGEAKKIIKDWRVQQREKARADREAKRAAEAVQRRQEMEAARNARKAAAKSKRGAEGKRR